MAKKVGIIIDLDLGGSSKRAAELKIEIDGISKAIAAAKKAGNVDVLGGLIEQQAKLRGELTEVNKSIKDQAKLFDQSKNNIPTDSLIGLTSTYRKLRREIDQLSDSQRNSDFGKNLISQARQIKTQIDSVGASVGDFRSQVGNYKNSVIEALDATGLVGGNITALFAGGGIVAGAAVAFEGIQKGIEYVANITTEFTKLRGEIATLTGATGSQLSNFTAQVAAIGDTFGQNQDEIVRAANNASKALGITFGDALNKIQEGFIAGSDTQGEFLDSVREYGVFFQEAGLSANDFFKVLNTGGLGGFSDKLVDATKEAAISLRELPKATQDALKGIGIPVEQIRATIAEKGIGAAIAQVSERLGQLEADSPAVGAAIADIFRGAGEDAGLNLLLTLKDLGNAQGSLIDQANQYQQRQLLLLNTNKELALVQDQFAQELAGTGATLEVVGKQVETGVLRFFLELFQNVKSFLQIFAPLRDAFFELAKTLGLLDNSGRRTAETQAFLNTVFQLSQAPLKLLVSAITGLVQAYTFTLQKGREFLEFLGIVEKRQKGTAQASTETVNALLGYAGANQKATESTIKTEKETAKFTKTLGALGTAVDNVAKGSIAFLEKKLSDLNKQLSEAPSTPAALRIQQQIDDTTLALEKLIATRQRASDSIKGVLNEIDTIQFAPGQQVGQQRNDTLATPETLIPETVDPRVAREKSAQETIKQLRQSTADFTAQLTKDQQEKLVAEIEATKEYYEKVGDGIFNITAGIISGQEELTKDGLKSIISLVLESVEKVILLQLAQAFGVALASPDSVLTGGITGAIKYGVVAGLIKGFFGLIKSQVQGFATGGIVGDGIQIRSANGDNRLITARTGEVILNESQQRRLNNILPGALSLAGVPGITATPTFSTPQIINPNQFFSNSQTRLSGEDIAALADSITSKLNRLSEIPDAINSAVVEGFVEAQLQSDRRRQLRKDISL